MERSSATIRTLIADDEPLARERLRALLAGHPDIEVVGECSNGADAIEAITELRPDLVLLDVEMPEADGFAVLEALGRERGRVDLGGRTIELSRRHTEILALLSARPAGMTAEELAADLYGDAGQPGTIRVQVHRLRKLLGAWIDTEPYRLAIDVESDLSRVRGCLDRGAVRVAAEHYAGPLLPRSEAPGIVRERDQLETWLRQAVLTADDTHALWAWLQSPSGENDALAWRRLLAQVDHRDPRRSLAASRLAALRAEIA
jgi:DNA-binding NarL/FixJ family response regulator